MKPAATVTLGLAGGALVGLICGCAWAFPTGEGVRLTSRVAVDAAIHGGGIGAVIGAVIGLGAGLVAVRVIQPEPSQEDALAQLMHLLRYCPGCKKAYEKARPVCPHCGTANPAVKAKAAKAGTGK